MATVETIGSNTVFEGPIDETSDALVTVEEQVLETNNPSTVENLGRAGLHQAFLDAVKKNGWDPEQAAHCWNMSHPDDQRTSADFPRF